MLTQDDFFSAAELGLDELNQYITVNISEKTDDNGNRIDGVVTAVIDVQENLKFHRDLDRSKGDPHNQLFQEDGLFSEGVYTALETIITERYKGEDFSADGDVGDDEDFIQFTLVLDVPEETTPAELGNKIWEDTEIVAFHNESDPGTFGSPYLFGSLISDEIERTES